MFFFVVSSNYRNIWVTFKSSYETKKFSMENIIRLMLEEIIMSDRLLSDVQIYSFLQLFFNTEKISLN